MNWLRSGAQLLWLVVLLVVAGILSEMIPRNIEDTTWEWAVQQTRPAVVHVMPFQQYVLLLVALEYLAATVYLATACLIIWRKADDWVAIFVSLTLLLMALFFGISGNMDAWRYPQLITQLAPWLSGLFPGFTLSCYLLLFFLFPNGRFVTRWMGWLAGGSVVLILLLFSPILPALGPAWRQAQSDLTWGVTVLALLGATPVALFGQIARYRAVASPVERQQVKWVLFGLGLPIAFFISHFLINTAIGWNAASVEWAVYIAASPLVNLALPLAIAFSILRYRLWEIDLILNRTLVYGVLTGMIALLYIVSVGLLGAFSQLQSDNTVPVLALLVILGAALPMRNWLQGVADQVLAVPFAPPNASPASTSLTTSLDPSPGWPATATATQGERFFFLLAGCFSVVALLWLLAGLAPGFALLHPPFHAWLRLLARTSDWSWLRALAGGLTMATYYSEPLSLLFFEYLFSLVSLILGIALLFRRPHDWVARLLALGMIGTAAIFNLQTHSVLTATGWPFLELVHEVLHLVAGGSYALALVLFPDGHPPALRLRWLRPLRVISFPLRILWLATIFMLAGSFTYDGEPVAFVLFFGLVAPLVGISAQAIRYANTRDADARRLSRTVMLTLVLGLALSLVIGLISWLVISPRFGLTFEMRRTLERITFFVFPLLYLMLPVSLWLIVLRHRLWELDILINRSLVYGVLTTAIAALYIAVVGVLGVTLQGRASWLVAVLVTGLIAILFHPLRQGLQRRVNRLMYGQRDDPVTVLASLRTRLADTSTPEMVLITIVETLYHTLKLPYTAIALKHGEELRVAASFGKPTETLEIMPLFYQRERVGEVRVALRGPNEELSPADHRLLGEFAQHAGAAVHAATLTADLQESRERLVTAREEERRRLRRDLHDGLGPQLATLSLRVDAARNLLRNDPDQTDRLLAEVKGQMQSAIADIRRLVYELRPPALDQLGLASALREYAATHPDGHGVRITVDAPATLPTLPAAVEVAAYRIALEAMTNVVRHAQAHQCRVRLSVTDDLALEISDDGVGLPRNYQAGVGLASMRERVAELGGKCTVEPISTGGTRVAVVLPIRLNVNALSV